MELVTGLDTQTFVIFLGVVVALGCTLVAFLVDYLKGKNERLREQVLEMTVRQEERARQPQLQLDSNAVLTAIAQVGRNLENVVRTAVHSEATPETVVQAEPVYQPRLPAYDRRVSQIPLFPSAVATPAPIAGTIAAATVVVAAMAPATAEFLAPAILETQPAEIPLLADIPVAPVQVPEPDWRTATWHQEPVAAQAPPVVEAISPVAETPSALHHQRETGLESVLETTITSTRESLRSLFESPSSIAKASQLEFEHRLDETIPEAAGPMAEVLAPTELPLPEIEAEEPVVRIRVLNNNVSSSSPEEPLPAEAYAETVRQDEIVAAPEPEFGPEFVAEAEPVHLEIAEAAIEVAAAAELPEPALAEDAFSEVVAESLPVTAPIDFLTAADLGETVAPAPHESFDSLMAAVNAEPGIAPAEPSAPTELEASAEPEDPGVLTLPSGMNDRATLDFLKRDKALFTGLIVSIGINDYARLQDTSGRPAAEELAKSVSQLVKSLIVAPNGNEFFGCRSSDDEFVVVFANENGSVAQRRLNGLSERLWDFQLRSLGNFSVMFSWGATEANGETFADAVEAASERMRETRHNRRTISMEKTRLKKVVNG